MAEFIPVAEARLHIGEAMQQHLIVFRNVQQQGSQAENGIGVALSGNPETVRGRWRFEVLVEGAAETTRVDTASPFRRIEGNLSGQSHPAFARCPTRGCARECVA